VTTAPAQISDIVGDITARLVARHDAGSILRAVTDACATLLSSDATGILVTDPRGGMGVVAASDRPARITELWQAQFRQGPCVDCINGDTVVTVPELAAESARWPEFAPVAVTIGFRAVHAFPLRLDGGAIGGLNLLYAEAADLTDRQVRLGQALADLAVLGLTQERDQRRVERLAEKTLTTLNDGVLINQAVGLLAGALDLAPDAARAALSGHSARSGRSLREVAGALAEGTLTPDDVCAPVSGG
jgi:GAF domain-containing protein